MTKDNIVTIAMIVLLVVMLIFAAKAVLTNNSTRDAKAASDHLTNSASITSEQPGSTPLSSEQLEDNDKRIWTSQELRRAQPYPMPPLPGDGFSKAGSIDTTEGPPTGAEGGKPTRR